MKTTGAQLITTLLERQGIDIIAGIPGGANLPLYDALRASRIRHVLARHEQGAGFIAQGMARATGRPAVCFGTSGPGATNLLTAIADAKLDSIPLVAITGQVPRAMIGTDAFQEIDTYGLTIPITKHNYLVRSAGELLEVIPDAFRVAASGRPGPVVVDVPKDVQNETIEVDALPAAGTRRSAAATATRDDIARAAALINAAQRPLLLIGAGIIAAGASAALRRLAETASIPVAADAARPRRDAARSSALPRHGRHARGALHEPAARGVRPADRARRALRRPRHRQGRGVLSAARRSSTSTSTPASSARSSSRSSASRPTSATSLRALDAADRAARRAASGCARVAAAARRASAGDARRRRSAAALRHHPPHRRAASTTTRSSPPTSASTRCGWRRRSRSRRPRQWLTSGGLGTMGFGLPAAIGAALAAPERTVVCFTGDGSLLMNLQELATAAEEDVNVKVILLNNGHLGLVRQQQQLFYGGRYHASRFHAEPDFAAIARGFGVAAYDLGAADDPLRDAGRRVCARPARA